MKRINIEFAVEILKEGLFMLIGFIKYIIIYEIGITMMLLMWKGLGISKDITFDDVRNLTIGFFPIYVFINITKSLLIDLFSIDDNFSTCHGIGKTYLGETKAIRVSERNDEDEKEENSI